MWYTHRPLPPPVTAQVLFPGVTYSRELRDEPHPVIIHRVTVDLTMPGLDLFLTPPAPQGDYTYTARTTAQFLDDFDLQLAVNAGSFTPWVSGTPWDYYPRSGDGVDPLGLTVINGRVVNEADTPGLIPVYITPDNRVTIHHLAPQTTRYDAFSGLGLLVVDGYLYQQNLHPLQRDNAEPRTALGLDESGETLLLVVVDGRQPNYSEGLSLPDLAQLMLDYGAYKAVNLDGGGSSTLVIADAEGKPQVLNSPIQGRIPGQQRPVATHLGIKLPNS